MSNEFYLFDTHAFYGWVTRQNVTDKLCQFFDEINKNDQLFVSSINFWEIALLVKSKRLSIKNVEKWATESLIHSQIKLIQPSINDMIQSTQLPNYHRDPFDRLLVAQANNGNAKLVTKDKLIKKYDVKTFWL